MLDAGICEFTAAGQVELCECVPCGGAHCRQQVNGVVGETIAVGKVQFC